MSTKRYVVKSIVAEDGTTYWYVHDTALGYNTAPVATQAEAEKYARAYNRSR